MVTVSQDSSLHRHWPRWCFFLCVFVMPRIMIQFDLWYLCILMYIYVYVCSVADLHLHIYIYYILYSCRSCWKTIDPHQGFGCCFLVLCCSIPPLIPEKKSQCLTFPVLIFKCVDHYSSLPVEAFFASVTQWRRREKTSQCVR